MEFVLLGGMILMMSLLNRTPAMKEANRALASLQIPIGVVAFIVGLSLLAGNGPYGRSVPAGIMGVVSGVFLLFNLLKLVATAEESIDNISNILTGFQVPVGILTIITVLIAMF
jgi:hypothetical protein